MNSYEKKRAVLSYADPKCLTVSLSLVSLSRDLIINRAYLQTFRCIIVVRKIHGSVSRVELNFDSSKGRDFREFRFLDFIPKARFPFDFN